MKIMSLVGARPQFIKAAPIHRVVKRFKGACEHTLVHTGQHYDKNMSEVFFEELQLPKPTHNLNVGSAHHAVQTARIMEKLEPVLSSEKPDVLLVYGDTNSTLAGALTAIKCGVPIAHVEAGLRSFNFAMPEEVNRVLTDRISTVLFCPSKTAGKNLYDEGIRDCGADKPLPGRPRVSICGDVMYDHILFLANQIEAETQDQFLLTLHRDFNTDHPDRLKRILMAINDFANQAKMKVVFPIHPRTRKHLAKPESFASLEIIDPLSQREILTEVLKSRVVFTDSGGLQKEAFYLKKPTVILRPETEWTEILQTGAAVLVDDDPDRIQQEAMRYLDIPPMNFSKPYGDGRAAEFIIKQLMADFG